MRRFTIVLVVAGLLAVLLPVAPASAAFPGGNGKIVFQRSGHGLAGIWTVNPDGSGAVRIIPLFTDAFAEPRWSANGRRLVLQRYQNMNESGTEIWTANATGGDRRRITTNDVPDVTPDWSPDGSKIVFARWSTRSHIWVMNANGSGAHELTFTRAWDTNPSWSPLGGRIAFERDTHRDQFVMGMTARGDNVTRLAKGSAPDWSPNAQRITFEDDAGVYAMQGNGTHQKLLAPGGHTPAWSPDGTKIAYVFKHHVWVMHMDGSHQQRVTSGLANDEAPDWQPLP